MPAPPRRQPRLQQQDKPLAASPMLSHLQSPLAGPVGVPLAHHAGPLHVSLAAPSAHVVQLAANGQQRRYRAKTLLIQEGDLGDTLFIIQTGRLRAFAADANGKEITLGIYGPGDYVGEMSLDGGPRSANVETLEACLCSVVTREELRAYIAANPDFAFELMARLIRRARLATESARNLALIDVYGRLTRLLNQLAGPDTDGGERPIAERLTHQDMANHVACSREMISRLLKDLERGGYVAVRERRLVLLRPLPTRW